MGLIELMASLLCVFIISYGLFLMRPYPEPIITEGKIVEKIMSLDEVTHHTPMPYLMQMLYIVILLNNGRMTKIRVGAEKYDSLKVDDPVKITEYSRIKIILEKKTEFMLTQRGN